MKPTVAQCEALMVKHDIQAVGEAKQAIINAIKEAYRAGMSADLMQLVHKKEEKAK